MSPDEDRYKALQVITGASARECLRSALGNLLEGHLKVVAAEALLDQGYSIMEGANARKLGRVVSLSEGRLRVVFDERPIMLAAPGSSKRINSPDIRVWFPCRLVVEIQVRSQYGSQSALFSENFLDDVKRVRRGAADAFVLAADRVLYEGLRGVKRDSRGRKAKHQDSIVAILPAVEDLGASPDPRTWPIREMDGLVVSGALLKAPYGVERCIVGISGFSSNENGPKTH